MEEQKKVKRIDRTELLKDLDRIRLYNCEEASELLGVAKMTVVRAIKKGHLNPVYVGRFLRISAEEIQKFVGTHALTVREVSNVLCVSTHKIRVMIKEGTLKAVRLSDKGNFRVPAQEVELFMKQATRSK